jgi:flagellar protein FlaG
MEIRATDNTTPPLPISATNKSLFPATPAPVGTVAARAKANAAADEAAPAPSREQVTQALKSINSMLQDRAPGLEFTVDRDSAREVVRVVDKETHEVIRQMPSREAIDIAKALDKLHSLLVKASA